MLTVVLFITGLVMGYFYRDVKEEVNKIKNLMLKVKPIPKSGVTMGSYAVPPKAESSVPRRTVVTPKSPQRVELERQQKIVNQDIIERSLHPWG